MGKKSRSKTSKSAASRSEQPDGVRTGAIGIGKQRCVKCASLIKDTSKAHACPGCSVIYCWRCERKAFEECPNGEGCVHPLRRCRVCASGRSLSSLMEQLPLQGEDGNPPPPEEQVKLFENYLAKRGDTSKWNTDTIPFQICGGDGCKESECRRCFTDPSAVRRLMRCVICCGNATCEGCFATYQQRLSLTIMKAAEREGILIPEGAFELISKEDLGEIRSIFLADIPDVTVSCTEGGCNFVGCFECLDQCSMERCLRHLFLNGPNFRCNTCYWSAKPCINPNCPNDPGVPTKRCGNCHLARYCSVECQAAAYPSHVGRCQKIKEKRVVARGLAKNNGS